MRLSHYRVLGWRFAARLAATGAAVSAVLGFTVYTAILAKEASVRGASAQPLAVIESVAVSEAASPDVLLPVAAPAPESNFNPAPLPEENPGVEAKVYPPGTRFFNGRPIRPARTITMKVTAYSPDWRSCGDSADGYTATLHHVTTNGHKMVAADPRILPYGSLLTIPGYDDGNVVPVLDCGGAIKGHRLDVLYPTHERAKQWGVQTLRVTVWEYADGKPLSNPRRYR